MKKIVCIICLFVSCNSYDTSSKIILDKIPDNQIEFQKMVIGQLTGKKRIKTSDNTEIRINSRWNSKEKKNTRNYLKALLEQLDQRGLIHSYKIPNVNFGVDLLIEPLKGNNLYSVLPSTTQSQDYVILGAHYDTSGENVPGAIDNGTGIALILSVYRRVMNLDHRTKNLLIVFFDQEEEDVSAGSRAFAQYLKANNYDIHSVHTFDLIGWDGNDNKEVELALPSPEIETLYRKHAGILNIPIYVSTVTSTDHYSFISEGIDAFCMSQAYAKQDNSGKKHTIEDNYNLVNFEYLDSSTNLAFRAIKDILNE